MDYFKQSRSKDRGIRAITIIILLTIVAGRLDVTANDGRSSSIPAAVTTQGVEYLENYELMFPQGDSPGGVVNRLYITYSPQIGQYEILDSITAAETIGCDTNAFIYLGIDELYTHLISVICSRRPIHDTLLSLKHKDTSNWINEIDFSSPEYFSLEDSTLVYTYGDTIIPRPTHYGTTDARFSKMKVVKILPENRWVLRMIFPVVYTRNRSFDKSQILICTGDSVNAGDPPYGSVLIYDFKLDSAYLMPELGTSNYLARRLDRESNVYLIKESGRDWNLWEYSKEDGLIQLTELQYPRQVVRVRPYKDYVEYNIRNQRTGEVFTEYISLDW